MNPSDNMDNKLVIMVHDEAFPEFSNSMKSRGNQTIVQRAGNEAMGPRSPWE